MGARATAPAARVRRFLRRNLLAAAITAVFAVFAVMLALGIDRLGFVPKKRDMLKEAYDRGELFSPELGNRLAQSSYNFLTVTLSGGAATNEREVLHALMEEIMAKTPAVAMIDVRRGEQTLMRVEDESRVKSQNLAENSLLSRDSTFVLSKLGNTSAPGAKSDRQFGTVRMEFTTPPASAMSSQLSADLASLVSEWRLKLIGLVGVLVIVYLVLLFGVLLPVRRVVSMLDAEDPSSAPLLERTHSLLEELHNNLARDATLARLSASLREVGASAELVEVSDLVRQVPDIVGRQCGLSGVQSATLVRAEESHAYTLMQLNGQQGIDWYPGEGFAELLQSRIGTMDESELSGNGVQIVFTERGGNSRSTIFIRIASEPPAQHLLILHGRPGKAFEPSPWWRDYHGRIARELEVAAAAIGARRKLILQEKSKANISLSRNLGHDLTNIIATAKLELMALRTLMAMPAEEIAASAAKRRVLAESVESLLNTTKFMQETVNLYRSFAYLSRPKFEEVSLAELCDEAAALFRLSISSTLTVVVEAKPALPPIRVEPRLLRLALFNLLTNATDAIKRGTETSRGTGTIRVAVRAADHGAQEIIVSDSGPGIRSPEGRLLEPEEIGQIFRLGYSTKGEGEGDGLGLNWVQTIVTEFHGGRLVARNGADGGAEFSLLLPGASPA